MTTPQTTCTELDEEDARKIVLEGGWNDLMTLLDSVRSLSSRRCVVGNKRSRSVIGCQFQGETPVMDNDTVALPSTYFLRFHVVVDLFRAGRLALHRTTQTKTSKKHFFLTLLLFFTCIKKNLRFLPFPS